MKKDSKVSAKDKEKEKERERLEKERAEKEIKEREKKKKEKKKDGGKVFCTAHAQQEYLFYCCNKLLCGLCLLDHRSHPFQSVEEALKLQREKLPPLNSELDRAESQVNQYITYKSSQRDQLLMAIALLNEEIGRGQKKKSEISDMRERIKDVEEDMEDAAFFIGPAAVEGGGGGGKVAAKIAHSPGGGEVVVDKLKDSVDSVLGDFAEELHKVLEESKVGGNKLSLASSRVVASGSSTSTSASTSLSQVGPSLSFIACSPSSTHSAGSSPSPFTLELPTVTREFDMGGSKSKTPRIEKKRVTKNDKRL